jgi:hypothetical protein
MITKHDEAGFVSTELPADVPPVTLPGSDTVLDEQPNGRPLDASHVHVRLSHSPSRSDYHINVVSRPESKHLHDVFE